MHLIAPAKICRLPLNARHHRDAVSSTHSSARLAEVVDGPAKTAGDESLPRRPAKVLPDILVRLISPDDASGRAMPRIRAYDQFEVEWPQIQPDLLVDDTITLPGPG